MALITVMNADQPRKRKIVPVKTIVMKIGSAITRTLEL